MSSDALAPPISVVICTRDRADLFAKALASLEAQDFPRANFEVVVVDNASSDHTGQVAHAHAGRLQLRYVLEERVGLCIARNTGWQAARGRYVALLDDDGEAEPGWLDAMARAFAAGGSSAGVVGGRVVPVWLAPRPPWLADEIAGALTIIDWGDEPKVLHDINREWLAGANMAAPRSVLEQVGGFHPWLDRSGNRMLSSGDTWFQKQVVRAGYDCIYAPDMAIRHLAPPSRLTQDWFRNRFYWQGMSDAVMQIIEQRPGRARRMKLAARRLARVAKSGEAIGALALPTQDPARFRRKCLALIDLGFAAGIMGAAGH